MPERMRWNRKEGKEEYVFRRGDNEFEDALREITAGYVDTEYPGLESFAYRADLISIASGYAVMHSILRDIEKIRLEPGENPLFQLRGERAWRSVVDTDDFPQPTEESLEEEDEEEYHEEEEG